VKRILRAAAVAAGVLALALVALSFVPERVPPTGAWLLRLGIEARFETVDGVSLRYVRTGSGPSIVLVHGFGSSIHTWKELIPPLAAGHDVLALDLPGFGASGFPERLSAAHLPRAVLGLMDRLGVERATLAGNSLGGATALWVAAERPERVARLVLIDSAGLRLHPRDRPLLLRLLRLPGASLAGHLPVRGWIAGWALRRAYHDPTRVKPEDLAEYVAPALRPRAAEAAIALALEPDPTSGAFAARLGGIRAPALVIWGREDRFIPAEDAERFAAALPAAEAFVLDGCGHVPQEECAAEVTGLMLDFLAKPPAETSPSPAASPSPGTR
jgi:pimeloyl-ACP methyl ester carboxylesterase